jgi:2-methylisocitrate lyase-like PEP mutase family enzyme
MTRRPTLRSLMTAGKPLVTPVAHDALSARLIELAGFRSIAIGGSSMLAARFALPDLGLAALAEMVAGARDILAATTLPCSIDGDDGYGDVKGVVQTVRAYEAIGIGGITFEDQARVDKQPGQLGVRSVVSEAEIEQKLRAALDTRSDPDLLIVGRTDAYGVAGLDAALRRAERFLAIGVDGIFIAGVTKDEDLARIGRALHGTLLTAVVPDAASGTWLTPAELFAMGFSKIVYPSALILRVAATMATTLRELLEYVEEGRPQPVLTDPQTARAAFQSAVDLQGWQEVERKYLAATPLA